MTKNVVESNELHVIEEVVSVTCDICETVIRSEVEYTDGKAEDRFTTVEWVAGYGSHYHGQKFTFDVCDNCSMKFSCS